MVCISIQAAMLALASLVASMECAAPLINQPALAALKNWEGFRRDIYKDQIGQDTVGYGHLCKQARCSEVAYAIPLSDADGERLLRDDLSIFETCITQCIDRRVRLNDNQYGALVSWAFNMGCNAAKSSELIRAINAGQSPRTQAEVELPKYSSAGGIYLPDLARRRQEEVVLFNTPSENYVLPPPGC